MFQFVLNPTQTEKDTYGFDLEMFSCNNLFFKSLVVHILLRSESLKVPIELDYKIKWFSWRQWNLDVANLISWHLNLRKKIFFALGEKAGVF